jgi:2-succinyl-5-enolpyruvyl-6-hydroxy-3-cyclohexene-1-carboxylate synthase
MSLCDDLMANTPPRQETETTRAWMGRFTRLDHLSRQVLCETLSEPSATADQARVAVAVTGQAGVAETEKDSGGDLFEGEVPITLAEVLPEGSTVYVGNSMPVRDFDSFWPGSPQAVTFLGNRGANGIDGVVSSALGASTQQAPLVLVIGDLSFYHDMNGLLAAKLHRLSATIIVVNNQGGAIFSFLPQAQLGRFEELFAVPLGLDYALAVEMYGGRFFRVRTRSALREAVTTSLAAPGLKVIEVISDRGKNYRRHQQLWDQLNARVDQFLIDAGQGQA